MSTPISIRSVTKAFPAIGASGLTRAVDDVSIDIDSGELFFLLGPSGCGKTTLLRMIAGFIDPTAGTIRFGERDVTHLPPNQRNTGMVFQSYALWPHMTVEANVAFGLDVRKTPAAEAAKRVSDALEAVQMSQYSKRKPNQLSGGQQQRIALARALVIRPDVLLLDEPLSNLDAKLRLELRSEIRRICKKSGITTVYVTHDQKEALSMADRVAILRAGRLEQVGPPEDLYRRPRGQFVAEFLGETNILPGRVIELQASIATLETSIGRVTGTIAPGAQFKVGDLATLSIRPESIVLQPGGTGEVLDSVYLGEVEQGELRQGEGTLKYLRLSTASPLRPGASVTASFHVEHVVVLPPSNATSGT